MNAIKKIMEVKTDELTIKLPDCFKNKQVEVIVLEIEKQKSNYNILSGLPLHHLGKEMTTFSRKDIYDGER